MALEDKVHAFRLRVLQSSTGILRSGRALLGRNPESLNAVEKQRRTEWFFSTHRRRGATTPPA